MAASLMTTSALFNHRDGTYLPLYRKVLRKLKKKIAIEKKKNKKIKFHFS